MVRAERRENPDRNKVLLDGGEKICSLRFSAAAGGRAATLVSANNGFDSMEFPIGVL